ncbi:autophagy-related protein 18c-like isoform X2 [Dioscorea cayenensis subsp. rotundata]|uniref:Autophagy-related protein 18c-like isoform X2 n=1 Tax=Dioscorea cayennensis subsp. rotundata TaxID=55577 RepID=A0AB40BWE3_DIOCR|nr:autophagy-related protein 18c-like isoform X2 [Dioscorea cayenensis subsp. rotundata]
MSVKDVSFRLSWQTGQVRVEHFGLLVTKFISAHEPSIACLTLTMDGLLLATASVKGTLIRIFNTMDGTRLLEVHRGVDKAEIYSISLCPTVQWLAASSDKGTVHLLCLRVRVSGEGASAQTTSGQAPGMVHQNSSTSLDAFISPNMGANANSSLSFMIRMKHFFGVYCQSTLVRSGPLLNFTYQKFLDILLHLEVKILLWLSAWMAALCA